MGPELSANGMAWQLQVHLPPLSLPKDINHTSITVQCSLICQNIISMTSAHLKGHGQ